MKFGFKALAALAVASAGLLVLSHEMLVTAHRTVGRAGLGGRIRLARADATSFACKSRPSSTSPKPLEITWAKRSRPLAASNIGGISAPATAM